MTKYLLLILLVFLWIARPKPSYVFHKKHVKIVEIQLISNTKFDGMVLYPFIFIEPGLSKAQKDKLLAHEYVHIVQQRKEGFLFLIKYPYNFMIGFLWYLVHHNDKDNALYNGWIWAYQNNPYEKEARQKESLYRKRYRPLEKVINR